MNQCTCGCKETEATETTEATDVKVDDFADLDDPEDNDTLKRDRIESTAIVLLKQYRVAVANDRSKKIGPAGRAIQERVQKLTRIINRVDRASDAELDAAKESIEKYLNHPI